MPSKKQAATTSARTATVSAIRPTKRTTPSGDGLYEVIDFDSEVAAADKARKPKKFRLRGYDYTLGKGPNPYMLQSIDTTQNFDVTAFMGQYIIPKERAKFLEAIRTADYDHGDFELMQRRIMEASADRPIAAS